MAKRIRVHSPLVLGIVVAVIALAAVAVLAVLLLGDDDEGQPSATATPTLSASTGQTVSDGICNATVPIEWVDSGNGRGLTLENGRYMVFGGRAATDEAWDQAVQLSLNEAESHPDAKVTQGDDFVRIAYSGDTGLVYRGRFDTVYCDFSLTTTGRALTDGEKAGFEAAVASLGPA